jgi:hypothetical protein
MDENMQTQRLEQHDRKGPALPVSHADHLQVIQDIIAASPIVASLLPDLMRAMAADIEKAAHAHAAAADLLQDEVPLGAERMAHELVTDISRGLGRRLALDRSSYVSSVARGWKRTAEGEAVLEQPLSVGSTNSPLLRLKLLGTPEVSLDGVRLTALERCNRAALIIYILALHRRGLSVERLAAYIASESAEEDAFDTDASMRLGAVRTFIWRLRRTAGWPDIVVSPGELNPYQNRYRLPDNTACDVWDFEIKLDQAAGLAVRASLEPSAADQAAALRQDAILLYRGEFCKGIGAGAIAHAAGYLHHRYLQAVMLQAIYWKDKALKLRGIRSESASAGLPTIDEENAWLQALSNYRLAAQVEPYDEAAHDGVMLCHKQIGLRSRRVKTSK